MSYMLLMSSARRFTSGFGTKSRTKSFIITLQFGFGLLGAMFKLLLDCAVIDEL